MAASEPISLALEWEGVDGGPLPAVARIVDDGLTQFNDSVADFSSSLRFACIARRSSGAVVGGALARWWIGVAFDASGIYENPLLNNAKSSLS
jgi:hypothetical protein